VYHQKDNIYAEGRFEGHIDGDGHTIYGLYHSGYSVKGDVFDVGLIPVMKNGSIKNLNIDVTNLKAGENVAAFVARAYGDNKDSDKIIIENCSVQKEASICIVSTIIKDPNAGGDGFTIKDGAAAGFVAYAMNTVDVTIKNCYCLSEKISGDHSAQNYFKYAAFIGQTWNSYYKILNCYSLISPFNFVDSNFENRISAYGTEAYKNIYTCMSRPVKPSESDCLTILAKKQMIGPNALDHMSGLAQAGFIATKDYPIIEQLINNTVDGLAIQNMLELASMAAMLGGMSGVLSNLKVEIKSATGAAGTTKIAAGSIQVEPNKFYIVSSTTSQGGVWHTAWSEGVKQYDGKMIMMFVGEKKNGVAPGFVVNLYYEGSFLSTPTLSPWPLGQGAINDSLGFVAELGFDQNGTIMILN
jgi:hypothetical protein